MINLSNFLSWLNNAIWNIPFLSILIFFGIYLSIKLRFPQIPVIKKVFSIPFMYFKSIKNKDNTDIKSLMSILAGTLGMGNITGVASAILIGGVGSIFWIFVSSFLAIALSYAENLVALQNKKHSKYFGNFGGIMYVLDEVLYKQNLSKLFCIFTILASFGIGAMIQTNSVSNILNENYNISPIFSAGFIFVISCVIVFKGKNFITDLNNKIIPLFTLLYTGLCIYVLILFRQNIISSLLCIVQNAFGFRQIVGGTIGTTIIQCMSIGFSRGMFSNEAGMGSAPIFACTSSENSPKSEASVMATAVVIDTIIMCSLTGLAIVCSRKLCIYRYIYYAL